jgi:hypothetical protein
MAPLLATLAAPTASAGPSCVTRRGTPPARRPVAAPPRHAPCRARVTTRCDASPADQALEYGATSYVPSPMDVGALQSQLWVLFAVGAMTAYWWYVLVPGARVNLAVNKRSGKLRAYLEELKADDDRKLERFFYQKWLAKVDPETRYLLRDDPEEEGATAAESARVTKVTLGDTEGVTRDEAREESLEEIVRKAKNAPDFWSGDNPVLVGTAVSIGAAALFGQIPH